jgi:hypothetical protein
MQLTARYCEALNRVCVSDLDVHIDFCFRRAVYSVPRMRFFASPRPLEALPMPGNQSSL